MKGVVLHSGGLDSTVLLSKLLAEGHDCYPLCIDYGQRHNRELRRSFEICRHLELVEKWKQLDLRGLHNLIHSALSGQGQIPHGHYEAEMQKATVFPNRNMILLGVAAGYADTIGGQFVAYAAHSNDRQVYPDCRPEFIESVGQTIQLGTDGKVQLIEPFVDITKAQIIQLGLELEAPLELTWSCYEGGDVPCLQCGTCLERTEAFSLIGHPDPALPTSMWLEALQYLKQYAK